MKTSVVDNIKVIFVLLAKVVIFYIKFFIKIRKSSYQLTFLIAYRFQKITLTLKKSIFAKFCNFLQIFFDIFYRSKDKN